MAATLARKGTKRALTKQEAQAKVLDLIRSGLKIEAAMTAVDRSKYTYDEWRKTDPSFKAAADAVREVRVAEGAGHKVALPDFPEFCEELGQPLHPHQRRMWEVIQGHKPEKMHPAMKYAEGVEWYPYEDQDLWGRTICNIPPGHAKTTTFSINLVTWLIHRNPDIKVILVCKDQGLAKQILGAIKQRLTSPVYREIQIKYGPEGGWKDPDQSWTQTEIFVMGKGDGEKDPTVCALGIGGRIYGARADVIICDDAVTLSNVNEYDKQVRWLDQEVETRLDGGGLLALFGTRIAPTDLYSTLREMTDADDNPVYTYFSMPAVLEEHENGTWDTLWPYWVSRDTAQGAEQRCLYCYAKLCMCKSKDMRWMTPKFTQPRLRKIRRNEATWALVYQQQDVAEDATFNARAVEASVNSQRFPGRMTAQGMGHRIGGMEGLYVIAGLDPAAAGNTAMVIVGLDRQTGKRWVLDGFNNRNTSAQQLKDRVKWFTETYRVNEWVIESNAFQRYLTQDQELTSFLRAHGSKLTPHQTTANKLDPDFGVMGLAPLFLTAGEPDAQGKGGPWRKTHDKALIELPSTTQNAWVPELINQLVVWQPSGMKQLQKTDLVMALWFTDIAVRRILGSGRKVPTHVNNGYGPLYRAKDQRVINIADLRAAREAEEVA